MGALHLRGQVKALSPVRRAVPFDPAFFTRAPHFWPLRGALRALGDCADFPRVADLGRVFGPDPPVRFAPAPPPRRRAASLDPRALYDARITLDGIVPTRERCWHDFMNALVWGAFPRAKRALHARQHRAIAARIAPGATRLPPARTRELDALALLDEGGVVLVAHDATGLQAAFEGHPHEAMQEALRAGDAEALVFGHAIYESLALGVAPAIVAAIVVAPGQPGSWRYEGGGARDDANRVLRADAALARAIDDAGRLTTPAELKRVDLTSTAPRAWATDAPPDESVRPMAP